MKRSGSSSTRDDSAGPSPAVLRAKYLDYCSARVAEVLLRLSPDEMFLLAQDAARERNVEHEGSLSYSESVRLATDRISRDLALPDFAGWASDYAQDPERFEREMLGLWEADVRTSEKESA